VIAEMEALSIIPKAETMHLLMIGYANAKDTRGVQDVLKRFYGKSLKPSTKIMNTVLRSLVSPGVDDWASFMQNYSSLFPGNELEPDFRTYGLLLEACVKDKRVQDAVLIMDEIINRDIKITPETIEVFRSVVGHEICKEIEGKLHKVYTPKINPRTPTEIDKSLEFKKLWGVEPKAETPYSKMRHNPDKDKIFAFRRYVGDYYTIIRDYAKDGDVASVKNIMEEMISKKNPCDIEMLNTLLLAHSKNNDCLGAQEVMHEIRRKGMRANISTLRLTISAHAVAGNPDGALSVLKDAIAMNFRPGKAKLCTPSLSPLPAYSQSISIYPSLHPSLPPSQPPSLTLTE
jgi:pentatricopeptide repeat protein